MCELGDNLLAAEVTAIEHSDVAEFGCGLVRAHRLMVSATNAASCSGPVWTIACTAGAEATAGSRSSRAQLSG